MIFHHFVNDPTFGPDRFVLTVSKTEINLLETDGVGEATLVYAANGNLLVNMNGSTGEDVEITMLDMAGRIVFYTPQSNVSTVFSEPLTLKTGLYFVRVENKESGKTFTEKLFW